MAPQLLLLGLVINSLMFIDAQPVGVCNGRLGDNLPSEQATVNLYQQNRITRMRIYDPNPATLRALQGTNIELMLDVPNSDLQSLTDLPAARAWVQNNIRIYPGVRFRYIAVGNEVDPANSGFFRFVLPAMQNIHQAIVEAGLGKDIKVSTATYTGLLAKSYPPSAGEYNENVKEFMRQIITFLGRNNLPLLANIYPYFACKENTDVNLQYALFQPAPPVNDNNGRVYSNLFDAMLDAHYAAVASLGGGNLEIVVSETGWPSFGHRLATLENARNYYRNLIAHVKQGRGTPVKPGRSIETYLFAMFNENTKTGDGDERHFGVFFPDESSKYQLSF